MLRHCLYIKLGNLNLISRGSGKDRKQEKIFHNLFSMKGHYISNGNRLLTSNTLSPLFITFFDALRRHQLINRNLRILESLFALFSLIPLTRIVVTPAINDDLVKPLICSGRIPLVRKQ